MKKLLISLAMLLMLASTASAAEEMRLLIWSLYMPEDFTQKFEADTGVPVRVEYYESMEELIAKLQAGGVSQYDVIIPSDYIMPAMIELGLLKELDHAQLPNMANLEQTFIDPTWDPGNKYSVAYQWGTLGIMYRKDKMPDYDGSWSIMFDADKRQGPFVFIDSVREMLGCALVAMGKDVNTTDMDELKELLDVMLEAKRSDFFAGFDVGTGARSAVAADLAVAAIVYSGDGLRAMAEDPGTGYVNPVEGTVAWVDSMCIPAEAPHPELAHMYINWVLGAEMGAYLSNWTQYASPNEAAFPFINPEDFENPAIYPPKEYMARLQFLKDLQDDNRLYDEIWTMIKTR